jgi:hypothetical protein
MLFNLHMQAVSTKQTARGTLHCSAQFSTGLKHSDFALENWMNLI